MRVKVYDGTGDNFLGFGNYVGDVDVYVLVMPSGDLRSLANAEVPPPQEEIEKSGGGKLAKIPKNPKIILDSGKTVYGCQVYWAKV